MKFVVGLLVTLCSLGGGFSSANDLAASNGTQFVLCDLDLDDPDILAQLPAECQHLDEPTKRLLLKETESFKELNRKLLAYEASQGKHTASEIYMDMDFRRELYTAAALHVCQDIQDSLESYVQCLVEKRTQMIASIDAITQQ